MNTLCAFCGQTATGLATITTDLDGERRYCHGDDDPTPTCYEQAQGSLVNDILVIEGTNLTTRDDQPVVRIGNNLYAVNQVAR